ncbi:MAG: hypothetical protein ACE5PV_02715 [Candidatus Poribacteria bacterium]
MQQQALTRDFNVIENDRQECLTNGFRCHCVRFAHRRLRLTVSESIGNDFSRLVAHLKFQSITCLDDVFAIKVGKNSRKVS